MNSKCFVLCFTISVGIFFAVGGMASAVVFDVNMTLETAAGYTNEMSTTIGGVPGVPASVAATGDYMAQLDVSFGAGNVATINSISFLADTPGLVSYGSTTVTYGAPVLLTNILGTFDSPTGATAVSGGSFATSGHNAILNSGIIDASNLGGPVFDLSVPGAEVFQPMTGGPGTISVDAPYVSGSDYLYDLTLIMPVQFSQALIANGPIAAVDGTLRATGSFTQPVPEPGTIALLFGLALSLAGWRRRR